jgi:DNA (cytosine-5)-methyltransferase 1
VDFPGEDRQALARQLMEMPWATMQGISEAVPPAYTRWIGKQLMEQIK